LGGPWFAITSEFHTRVATDGVVLRDWNYLGEADEAVILSLRVTSFSRDLSTSEVGRKLALVSAAHAGSDTTLRVLLRALVNHIALRRVIETENDLLLGGELLLQLRGRVVSTTDLLRASNTTRTTDLLSIREILDVSMAGRVADASGMCTMLLCAVHGNCHIHHHVRIATRLGWVSLDVVGLLRLGATLSARSTLEVDHVSGCEVHV